ncbi:MAG: transcriptional regulator [Cyanobacteria bacterium CRU_2_1]|nr:transcriptional regulator [Cyanobacteria bacterium RU_5_0]NJR58133.1 transcriptional regulator [Cyanobacteria bacterium CRU_2_1]
MVFAKAPQSNCPSDSEVSTPSFNPMQLLQAAIEGFMDGIMIVTDQGEVIEANLRAREICCRLNPSLSHERQDPRETFLLHPLPAQIWQVCQALVESRDRFPNYPVISESEIVLDNSVMSFTIRVRVRWLDPDFDSSREVYRQRPCMLVMLEDRNQAIHNQAIADIHKYDLTLREGEIWQLRLRGNSYDEIGKQLFITRNTVQKHIKSILAKRRAILEEV